eukprot:UN25731
MFADQKFLYAFANLVLPGITFIAAFATVIAWGVGGDDDLVKDDQVNVGGSLDSDGIWAGNLYVSYILICIIMPVYLYIISWWVWQKDKLQPLNETEIKPDPFWSLINDDTAAKEQRLKDYTIISKKVIEDNKNVYAFVLLCSFASLFLYVLSAMRSWSFVEVRDDSAATNIDFSIRTMLWGWECSKDEAIDFVVCNDALSFQGTEERFTRTKFIMVFYISSLCCIIWGTYENIRNKMRPLLRLLWYGMTLLFSLIAISIFYDYSDTLTLNDVNAVANIDFINGMYTGSDATYYSDINCPNQYKCDAGARKWFICYVFAVLVLAVALGVQI